MDERLGASGQPSWGFCRYHNARMTVVFEAVLLRPHRYCPSSLEICTLLAISLSPNLHLRKKPQYYHCRVHFSFSPPASDNSRRPIPNRIDKDTLLQDVASYSPFWVLPVSVGGAAVVERDARQK